MEITKKLKELRIRNGYSKLYVSKQLGYKSNVLVRKEKGQRTWSITDIRKLCKLYNVSPTYLLSNSSDEEAGEGESDARKN